MKLTLTTILLLLVGIGIVRSQTVLVHREVNEGVDSSGITPVSQEKLHYVETSRIFTKLAYEVGYIMPVNDKSSVNDLLKASHYSSINISNSWEVSPNSVYSRIYRKPKLGLGFSFTSFHNAQLGNPYLIYGYTEVPINRKEGRWNFSYGMGLGLAWNFHHYDKVNNAANEAIGSAVNAHLQANISASYWLTDNFLIGLGTGFRHFSNGALQKPNAGVNIIPVQFSVHYKMREVTVINVAKQLPPFQKHWSYSLYNSVGAKQFKRGEPVVFKDLFGFNAGYQFSYKYKAVGGFDLTFTDGGQDRVPYEASNVSKCVSYGPYVGWEWYLTDRIYIPIYCGVYLHRNIENEEEGILYQRLGIRYLLLPSRQLSTGIGLKTHLGSADFIELNIGYTFRMR